MITNKKIIKLETLLFITINFLLFSSCEKNNYKILDVKTTFISNIDNNPIFSWKTNSEKNIKTSQILVSDNLEDLKKNVGNFWNSGKKKLNSVQTKYAGKSFVSGEKYFVKIRTWDTSYNVSSKISEFFAPIIYPEDWKAKWVTYDYNKKSSLPVFSKIIDLVALNEIKYARLYISAPGYYEAYLNGKKIGENVLDPGQTNYEDYSFYSAYNINIKELNCKNNIGIMLGNGWYNQNQVWGNGLPYGQPVFICQLVITYKNGEKKIIGSDDSWKWKEGPITYSNIYGGETYDANREVDMYNVNNDFYSGWENAILAQKHPVKLFEQFAEPIKKMGIIKVKKIYNPGDGIYVFDFGQNFSGFAQLKIKGEKGQKITIRFAEDIDSTKNIDPSSTGVKATKLVQTDKYVCKGEGIEIWEPRFTYHGFRYAEVTGLKVKPEKDLLTGIVVYSSVPKAGDFSCSEENINKLHNMSVWTIKGNIHSIPTDCPHRERCGWLGDSHAMVNSLFFNFDGQRFMTKYMLDIRSSARNVKRELYFGKSFHDRSIIMKPKGIPTMIAPGKRTSGTASPDWGTAMVQIPWYLYLYYGDINIAKEFYPDMKIWVKYIQDKNVDGIIYDGLGDWCPPEGNDSIECPVPVSSSAFHIFDVSIMKQFAKKFGYSNDYIAYSQMLDSLKHSFNVHFYDDKAHTYGCQTANVMALELKIVKDSERIKVAGSIVKDINEKHGGGISTGIFGLRWLFKVLCENGYEDEAYKLLTKKGKNSFAWMWEKYDATTLSERLPVYEYNYKSHSHPMQAGFDSWFYSGIAGINPNIINPGFKKIIFRPYLTDFINHADADYESKYGMIESHWKWDNGVFVWSVSVPNNCSADVYLPVKNEKFIVKKNDKEIVPEKLKLSNGKQKFCLIKNIESGKYVFKISYNKN